MAKKTNILEEPKGRKITLADGKVYTLAPITLHTLATLEQGFDCDMEGFEAKLKEQRSFTVFEKLLWIFLQDDYPNMTMKEVGKLVQVRQVGEVIKELTDALNELKV